MPIVKNTTKGNNFLKKINTDGDTCSRTAIRSYYMAYGNQGISNTLFTLPFNYLPGSHTLWVFVNGEKAVVEPVTNPSGVRSYNELTKKSLQFTAPVPVDAVLEFIVAGSYLNEEEISGSGGGGLSWIYNNANITPSNGFGYMTDTTSNTVTYNLPTTPEDGYKFAVGDGQNSFGTNNVTIVPGGGETIANVSGNFVFDGDGQSAQFIYDAISSNWLVVFDGSINSVQAGTYINIDNTDSSNPIVNVDNSIFANQEETEEGVLDNKSVVPLYLRSTYITREEFFTVLQFYEVTKIYPFTYVGVGEYDAANITNNNNFIENVFTVPSDLSIGTTIRVHMWGGGGYQTGDDYLTNVGGYSYCELVVFYDDYASHYSDLSNDAPWKVHKGMEIICHVGNTSGRAAIWRKNTDFLHSTYLDEILVAGGAGRRTYSESYQNAVAGAGGGNTGLAGVTQNSSGGSATGGAGGTHTAGGAGGTAYQNAGGSGGFVVQGVAGGRIWGAPLVEATWTDPGSLLRTLRGGGGGDGYYGGGSGSGYFNYSYNSGTYGHTGGGGGSGYVTDNLAPSAGPLYNDPFTESSDGTLIFPPEATGNTAWDGFAGLSNKPASVVFEIVPTA